MGNKKADVYIARRRKRPLRLSVLTRNVLITLFAVAAAIGIMAMMSHAPEKPSIASPLDVDCLTHVDMPDDVNEELLRYEGFIVSFNPIHHVPNYVAWELTCTEALGAEPRDNKFKVDDNVYGCATLDDYRKSGYDRGHMAPAGDMKWSRKAMSDSHFLTNICPQDHSINSGRWSTLEKKCRQWVLRDSALVIICGPILIDEISKSIGKNGVSVPERFFKVVLSPYTIPPRGIGFIIPNHPTDEGLESMATTIDNIEAITGFDFFGCLPDDIEQQVESSVRYKTWDRRKR